MDNIAQAYPEYTALKEENGLQHTYSQLQLRVQSIAGELLKHHVGPRAVVGVFQAPGADWICSLLAIWRLGATYIPLDKKVGMDRLGRIVQEARPLAVIVDSTTASDYTQLNSSAQFLNVSNVGPSNGTSTPNMAKPDQTAVIMYTSGSTGVPKGIAIRHSAYVHHIEGFSRTWDIAEAKETVLHQSSYAWDMSLYQILTSLCNGSSLIIADGKTRGDPVAISKLISDEKITTTFATPTEYLAWLRHGHDTLQRSSWSTAVSGGEFVSAGLIGEFKALEKPDLRLINVYGPAETTLACSSSDVHYRGYDSSSRKGPSGLQTLPNYSVYIVDDDLKPVPRGMPGEVVVGGAGIAQGYLDGYRTQERFLPDREATPFFQSQGWTSVHRTGDRGRLDQNGDLVLLGRIDGDNQIKLGGIRINVEEIEEAIVQASNGSISQAVVSARHTQSTAESEVFLVSFVVLADSFTAPSPTDFLKGLASDLPLPQYMRPAAIIPVDSIPQNTSGKIDRISVKKLPISNIQVQENELEALAPIEETLRQLWKETIPQEVFSLHVIDSKSDYFHVGGSSINLVNLQALIKDRLEVPVHLHQLFEASTLQGMAYRIKHMSSRFDEAPVNWEQEINSMLSATRPSIAIDTNAAPTGSHVVVLTGATGFIGKEILRQLVNDNNIRLIHCVAVRTPSVQLPAIFAHHKVLIHQGNLGAPLLGLSPSDAAWVFSQADIIIHNGADVSFMKSYHSLKLTNVASTEELVKLALPRQIPFHFISSASVTRLAAQNSFGESSVASYSPPSVPNDGYTAAKWICEVYLERVNRQFDLPVWIHRPSSVTGPGAPELDLMDNVMRYSQKTKKIPDSQSWSGVFDLISVQSVATQIIEAVHLSGSCEPRVHGARFLYEAGEIQLGQDEVQSLMELDTGESYQFVPVSEWVDEAERAGMSPLLGMYLRKAADGQVLLPRLVKGPHVSG